MAQPTGGLEGDQKHGRVAAASPAPVKIESSDPPGSKSSASSAGSTRQSVPELSTRTERWIVISLLVLCALNMVAAAVRNSAVADELGAHIPSGYLYWASGEYSGGIDNFPLGQLWIALPVKLLGLDYELFTEQHLLLFRLPVIVLGLVVVGLVYLFARRLYGQLAGLTALLLASMSPNLLAHSTVATLDLPTAWAIFVTVWLFFHYARRPSIWRLATAAAALAVALVIKIQTVLVLPVAAVALVLAVARMKGRGRTERMAAVASWLLIPGMVILVVNLAYLHLPTIGQPLPPAYVDAFSAKLIHGGSGHFAYLFGSYSKTGWWYFFPIAILLKTPVPAIGLIGLGLLRRQRFEVAAFVLLPIALVLGAGMVAKVDIGLRHVLAVYPFFFVLAGFGASRLVGTVRGRAALLVLMVLYGAQALWIQPHHLSYFNVLAGGPSNGYRFLVDSNFDWGQNDRFLSRHVAKTGVEYQINPDPFRPTSGAVLVNANALLGILNGGPAAYTWLRDLEPDGRVAYTWFEYRLPGDVDPERSTTQVRNDRLGRHLLALLDDVRATGDLYLRLIITQALVDVAFYQPALEEVRDILAEHPNNEDAVRVGGELVVRHKLGVLQFRGMEYLTGFRDVGPPHRLADAEVSRLAGAGGFGEQLSTLYTVLGSARFRARDLAAALDATRLAAALDPSNEVAADNLRQIRQIKEQLSR